MLQGRKVLIVDDDAEIRTVLTEYLATQPYNTVLAQALPARQGGDFRQCASRGF